jgi:hypothetical protein
MKITCKQENVANTLSAQSCRADLRSLSEFLTEQIHDVHALVGDTIHRGLVSLKEIQSKQQNELQASQDSMESSSNALVASLQGQVAQLIKEKAEMRQMGEHWKRLYESQVRGAERDLPSACAQILRAQES